MHRWWRKWVTLVVTGCMTAFGSAWGQYPGQNKKYGEFFEEQQPWAEAEAALPEYPKPENLVEFYVTAVASNRFFIDAKSLSVGADDVVRYVAVVKTPGGVSNVSFEGIRCQTKERRLYAFGRNDNSWARARSANWVELKPVGASRYQYVLHKEYFCPGGAMIFKPEEGLDALRRGGHPLK